MPAIYLKLKTALKVDIYLNRVEIKRNNKPHKKTT